MLGDNPWWKVLSGGQNNMWESLLSGLGGGLASGLTGGIVGKIFGGKKEKPLSGHQEGIRQKQYFQALYGDRLNPWEWAGSGGFGVGGTSAPIAKGIQDRNTNKDQLKQMLALESAKISKDITVAQINAEGQKKAAQAARGVTDDDPGTMFGDKLFHAKVREAQANIEKTQNSAKILETGVSLAKEFQQVLKTLKGDKETVTEALQKSGLGNSIEDAINNMNKMADNAMKITKGNTGKIKQAVGVIINKINQLIDHFTPNIVLDNPQGNSTSAPLK